MLCGHWVACVGDKRGGGGIPLCRFDFVLQKLTRNIFILETTKNIVVFCYLI